MAIGTFLAIETYALAYGAPISLSDLPIPVLVRVRYLRSLIYNTHFSTITRTCQALCPEQRFMAGDAGDKDWRSLWHGHKAHKHMVLLVFLSDTAIYPCDK